VRKIGQLVLTGLKCRGNLMWMDSTGDKDRDARCLELLYRLLRKRRILDPTSGENECIDHFGIEEAEK